MQHYNKLIFIVLVTLMPLTASAGGTAIIEGGGKIAWLDANTSRMDMEDQHGYMILRDGKAYMITTEGGQPRVIDMGGITKMMRGITGKAKNHEGISTISVVGIKKTGVSETVAGIKGRVYRAMITDANGKTESKEMVLTDDPLVVEMTQAYMGSMQKMFGGDIMANLPRDDRGMLRVGNDYRLQSISNKTPPASEFELPAEPTNFGQMLQQMMKQGMESQQ